MNDDRVVIAYGVMRDEGLDLSLACTDDKQVFRFRRDRLPPGYDDPTIPFIETVGEFVAFARENPDRCCLLHWVVAVTLGETDFVDR